MAFLSFLARQTPRGMRDVLPGEQAWKQQIETDLLRLFALWGYAPVATPTFEYTEALERGNGHSDKLYRFFDRDGSALALRPEVTTPIARLVATRLRDAAFPLRLAYVGSVFRYDEPQAGRHREFTQAGVELIGSDRPEADAEVVAMAVSALAATGLTNFAVDIGHVGYYRGIVDALPLAAEVKLQVRQAVLSRNLVALEEVLAGSGLNRADAERVLALPGLRGDATVLDRAADLVKGTPAEAACLEALANLREILAYVSGHGLAPPVRVDLGLLKDLDYYTGMVLEGYTADLGFSICSGGRYDRLLGRFDFPAPASGFALGVERLLLALVRQRAKGPSPHAEVVLCWEQGAAEQAVRAAAALRQRGIRVALEVSGRPLEAIRAAAGQAGAWWVVQAQADGLLQVWPHADPAQRDAEVAGAPRSAGAAGVWSVEQFAAQVEASTGGEVNPHAIKRGVQID